MGHVAQCEAKLIETDIESSLGMSLPGNPSLLELAKAYALQAGKWDPLMYAPRTMLCCTCDSNALL